MANWYIGPVRAAQLAEYAGARWDAAVAGLVEEKGLLPSIVAAFASVRQEIHADILTWEDEANGPHLDGVPLSETGTGAHDRYISAIDALVDEKIVWAVNEYGPSEPWSDEREPMVPRRGAPDGLAGDIGIRTSDDAYARPSSPLEIFNRQADALLEKYSQIMAPLKRSYKNQAAQYVESEGVDEAMRILEMSLGTIQARPDLSASSLSRLFGGGKAC